MNCETCGEWLDDYAQATLPPDVRAAVDTHLSSCPVCREELESCRRLEERLKTLPRHRPGDEVCMRVSEAIHAETPHPPRTEFGPVLSFGELAEYLRVDKETLELYVGDIPCFELGGRLLFRKARIEEWIEARERRVDFRSDWPAARNRNPSRNAEQGERSWTLAQKN